MKVNYFFFIATIFCTTQVVAKDVEAIFSERNRTQQVLDIEAALARAQGELGIIPVWAADEISAKARSENVPADEYQNEYEKVRHRMVALLNVWQRSLDNGAEQYMHYGATTVDIYDTLLVLQLKSATDALLELMRENELLMIDLAKEHADTLMIGRTLGQHALPITFGKKVSTWLGENRRNIERLQQVRGSLQQSAILKGAVGSYLGLGSEGMALENAFSMELGLSDNPYVSDWHPSRDVFAHYAYVVAMISRSYGRIGQEIFLLQSTDIGEIEEVRRKTAVGSSTMPHKKNPSKSEALIHYSRTIPRLAEVIGDDMVNFYERDNTSRPNRVIEEISIDTANMLITARALLKNLQVNADMMKANVMKTNGLVMSQRLVFTLAPHMGKTSANDLIHQLAVQSIEQQVNLENLVLANDDIMSLLTAEQIRQVFTPESYTGLAKQQTMAVIDYCLQQRVNDAKFVD
ncbi:lyase family protein [Thalassotalea mangrovi]|uniref:Adenylosuccinate lyase C-terminal domain-containing protein n=1 Tax=Thalassotalea mangrovi TaxID=2572245 RepID=A0A4U1B5C7_9GAMM|nr:lyase family protein [Thalassotalea mangrovi]TKB45594.1 hypothetical protein E8M12_08335 [Thalassotalea mangrovi]